MSDNLQLSPTELAQMGWNRDRKKVYKNGPYTIRFIYNVRLWVIYDKREKAMFNFDSLKSAVKWFGDNPASFPL